MIDWEYSESIESEEIVSIKKKYTNYIGGKFLEPKDIDSKTISDRKFRFLFNKKLMPALGLKNE